MNIQKPKPLGQILVEKNIISKENLQSALAEQTHLKKVASDKKITQVAIESDVKEGSYKIGLLHTDRGVYFSNKIIKITQNGTVKIESEYIPQKYYSVLDNTLVKIEIVKVILLIVGILIFLIILFIIYNNLILLKENKLTNKEINVIFTGEPMPLVNKDKKKRNGKSVKRKFVAFTFLLVTIVVIAVA